MLTFRALVLCLLGSLALPAEAATLQVPKDFKTIQAAIDAARPGDTVLVQAGVYPERLSLKERIIVQSAGDDTPGKHGLKRAEATIIDAGGANAKGPAVVMAEGATLDGFTVTRVGDFQQKEYDYHYATHGELLPDERGAVGGKEGFPALALANVTATVQHCIVRDNGHAGIGAVGKGNRSRIFKNVVYRNMGGGIGIANGAAALVEANQCFQNLRGGIGNRNSQATILHNESFDNVRAGIGIREGASPIVRGNKCYKNRRAGIGARMPGTNPIIEENECFDNEMAGIGSRDGAAPVIRNNRCYRNLMAGIGARDSARGVIENNTCHENAMAGIGCRGDAAPIIRFNKCYKNQMAGIGCREGARPLIEGNECYENAMAGIGARDGAAPTIRRNRCYKNEMAGIGCRLGARPMIVDNDCYENQLAGIGAREGALPIIHGNRCYRNDQAGIGAREGAVCLIEDNECKENKLAGIGARQQAVVTLLRNRCLENGKVAIGLRQGSIAFVMGNELARTGGMPPMIAIGEGSSALIMGNTLRGGGVAGILVEGLARIHGNHLEGNTGKSGSAIWALAKSDLSVIGNRVDGYRNLLNNTDCRVVACDNVISNFQGTAITIKKPLGAAVVTGNVGLSKNPQDKVTVLDSPPGKQADNVVQAPGEKDLLATADEKFWAALKKQPPFALPVRTDRQVVQEGDWKMVIAHGKKTEYKLYRIVADPQEKADLAAQLDNLVFRLRGRLERQEAVEDKLRMRKEGGGPK